jgi:hypothetical protein
LHRVQLVAIVSTYFIQCPVHFYNFEMSLDREFVASAFSEVSSLPVVREIPLRPKSGYRCLFEWSDQIEAKDWLADGYNWNVNGKYPYEFGGVSFERTYYKLRTGKSQFTTAFSKTVISCSSVPNRRLIAYDGDHSVVVDLPHGNSKQSGKTKRIYNRTKPSTIQKLKDSANGEKVPSIVFNELLSSGTSDVRRLSIDGPRNMKQVQNAHYLAKKEQSWKRDAIYNLCEISEDIPFVSDFVLRPSLMVLCFLQSVISDFKLLLNRSDLPTMVLAYDTTYECGNFYVSILTSKTQDVHDYFFRRLSEILPEILTANNVVICTDEEAAIVNSITKFLPKLKRFRCAIHAWGAIKRKLIRLGICRKEEQRRYKEDFYFLLDQTSENAYRKEALRLSRTWDKVISYPTIID